MDNQEHADSPCGSTAPSQPPLRVAAIIPARGGSKRIPGKNLQTVNDKPLVVRAIEAARGAGISAVYVSTDSDQIADVSRESGALVVRRPEELCTDTASTESAMVHWWRSMPVQDRPDVLVLLQCTSPLTTAQDVRNALDLLTTTGADSVVSVCVNVHSHFGGRSYPRCYPDAAGKPSDAVWKQFRPFRPLDYRPRTQDLAKREIVEENGAIYVTTKEAWLMTQNRMSGTIAEYRMDKWSSIDVDTLEDLQVADLVAKVREGK